MPRGDRTGPTGTGPLTGRRAGICAGYGVPGFMNPYGGRPGWGLGMGRGRGWGRWGGYPGVYPYAPPAYGMVPYGPDQEMEFLQNQAKALGDQLNEIQTRISELERESGKKGK